MPAQSPHPLSADYRPIGPVTSPDDSEALPDDAEPIQRLTAVLDSMTAEDSRLLYDPDLAVSRLRPMLALAGID